MKNHQARPTSAVVVPEVNDVDNHRHNRGEKGRDNERGLRPKNTHQKNKRNNKQAKIHNMFVIDVEEKAIKSYISYPKTFS